MAKYIVKNNIPTKYIDHHATEFETPNQAKCFFNYLSKLCSDEYPTKIVFRNNPLRGTIQVEIDGFYYYVELYKE